jgi:acetyl esterase/lipase
VRAARSLITGSLMCVAAGVSLTGCFPPPDGTAPLRYRDDLPGVTVTKTSDIVYSTSQDGTTNNLALDVYRPTPDTVTKRPLVVLVHGGSFRSGSKLNGTMVALANAYAKRGYVTASIDYRLLATANGSCDSPGADPQECKRVALAAQHDAQAAIRYLRANAATYGIDPTRVAIQGGSAGGGTALLVGVNEDDTGTSGTPGQSSTVGAAIPISGGVAPNARPLLIPSLESTDAPIYMIYGTADPSQPTAWPLDTVALLKEHGVSAFSLPVDGGHVPFGPTAKPTIIDQTSFFMYYALDLAHAQGQPASAAVAATRQLDRMRSVDPAMAREMAAVGSAR